MRLSFRSAFSVPRSTLLLSALLAVGCPAGSVLAESSGAAQGAAVATADPRTMTFEPVRFTPPEPERVVLENGMVVYLLEDHELPLVTVSAMLRTGTWLDPSDKVGLAGLTGVVMRTGGTQRTSAGEVDEALERIAASVSVGIGSESGSASLDVLTKDLDRGLQMFADILMTPAFDANRLQLAKLQAIEGIRRRQDQPQSIASREFGKLTYGPEHPFARESTVASITKITRDDVVAFHAKTIHPNGIILGITGDFSRDDMLARLRAVFGGWTKGTPPDIALPPPPDDAAGSTRLVRFIGKGTSQTHLRVGHLSLKENDPDYPALTVLNDILGGSSFRSRLFQDIRTKRGLAYSVGSGLRAGTHERGVWLMRAETKVESTQEAISRLIANMERLREEPVTDEELSEAKESFVNSFVFSFASPVAIVNRLMGLEYDGLPKDFIQRLRDEVVKVTKQDLLAVARKHLHPERLRILAVGPPQALLPLLSGFGDVKEIPLAQEG